MTVLIKLLEGKRKMTKSIFDEKWFPFLVIILFLVLSGWNPKTNIREGLLVVGFFLLGFVLGCLYTQKQFNKAFDFVKERTSILIEDLVSDLSRYAIVAGESYSKTKTMIYKYKEQARSILSTKQKK